MPKKRYTPETLLQEVVEQLEEPAERSHRRALHALLTQGPLRCYPKLQQLHAAPWGEIRAEVLAFLRTLVRRSQDGVFSLSQGIGVFKPLTISAAVGGSSVDFAGDGDIRDLVVLQLVMLLYGVGIGQVRVCRDTKCQRLFVKRYRRGFCSTRCQKRLHTYLARLDERNERERLQREKQLRRRRAR